MFARCQSDRNSMILSNFETIWQDRAAAARWVLEIKYEDPECLTCVFRFTRKS